MGDHFRGDDTVDIGLAEQHPRAAVAAVAAVELAAGDAVTTEHQWAFGLA